MVLEQLIAAGPTARRHRGAWYGDLIDAAEREGVTVASLASRLGVVAETIYAWRRKRGGLPESAAIRRATAGLVRVYVAEPKAITATEERPLELRLGRDRSVLVPRGFDREHLLALLSALKRCGGHHSRVASVARSLVLLNTQLTAKNVALEEELRVARIELRELRARTAQQQDTIAELTSTVQKLKATLEHLLKNQRRPETIDPSQGLLFVDPIAEASDQSADEQEKPEPEKPKGKPRKPASPSRRVADESNLRREVVRSELPPEQRRCPSTGVELLEVGVKVSKELDYRPGELVLVEQHQVIYGPPEEVATERNIAPLLAPAPKVAVEGVTASATLLAGHACRMGMLVDQRYVLHLPLDRLERVFGELGFRLARTTLSGWVQKVAFGLRLVPFRS